MPIRDPTTLAGTGRVPLDTNPISGDSSGVDTSITTVETGGSIQDAINREIITEPGIVPFAFYSLTNAAGQLLRPGGATALSIPVPFRGSVIGLSFQASTACSGTYTVYLNGGAVGAAFTVSSGTSNYQAWAKGSYGFTAGTLLDVRASSVTTSAVVELIAYVIQDPSPVS